MANSILALPPVETIAAAVAELATAAAGDTKRIGCLNRAQYDLMLGTQIAVVPGAFLVPSSSRGGLIHRVDHVTGCDCEAGRAGRQCRHKTAIEILEVASKYSMPALQPRQRSAAAARAFAEMDELYV